jgi:hypothetical protein
VFCELCTVVVIHGLDQPKVKAAQQHSLSRELDSLWWPDVAKKDKIGGIPRNRALVRISCLKMVPLDGHGTALRRINPVRPPQRIGCRFDNDGEGAISGMLS